MHFFIILLFDVLLIGPQSSAIYEISAYSCFSCWDYFFLKVSPWHWSDLTLIIWDPANHSTAISSVSDQSYAMSVACLCWPHYLEVGGRAAAGTGLFSGNGGDLCLVIRLSALDLSPTGPLTNGNPPTLWPGMVTHQHTVKQASSLF